MSSIFISTIRYLFVIASAFFLLIWVLDIKIKPSKSLHERIIGDPITIDSLEVAEFDSFGSYSHILEEVTEIGDGWRIPTLKEYQLLNENRENLKLSVTKYWTIDGNQKYSFEKIQFSIPSGEIYKENIDKNIYKRWTEGSDSDLRPVRTGVRFVRNISNYTYDK